MFVDLMNDIYHTFTERFLRAQISFEPQAFDEGDGSRNNGPSGNSSSRPTKRYNAMGVLVDVEPEDFDEEGEGSVVEIGPSEPPNQKAAVRQEPIVTGAGRVRSLNAVQNAAPAGDWSTVGRNDACPCGSGKKFKKCHGVTS